MFSMITTTTTTGRVVLRRAVISSSTKTQGAKSVVSSKAKSMAMSRRYPQQPQVALSRFLSTAAVKEEPKPRRRTIETKDPIILTERAADRIKEILNGDGASGALGIRVGVKRRGCNGLSYTLNYAFEKPEKDIEMESHGVKVYIEPMALFNVVGTVMDWEETELASEFTFNNPNSKGECGCGESFTV